MVVLDGGLVDPVEAVRLSPIAQALPADEFRHGLRRPPRRGT